MAEDKILIIDQGESYKRISLAIKKFGNASIVFVSSSKKSIRNFDGKNMVFKAYSDYVGYEELKMINKNALLWIKKWPDIKIKGNKSFKKLLSYKGTSLWWFVETWFYEASMFHYYSVEEIIRNVEIVGKIIDKEMPDKIILVDDKGLLSKIIKIIADHKKIQIISIPDFASSFRYELVKQLVPFSLKTFKGLKELSREFSAKLSSFFTPRDRKKARILMVTHPTYRQISVDPSTGEMVKEDLILGPIIRSLDRNRYEALMIDTDPFPTLRLNFLFAKGCNHIEGYLNGEIKKEVRKESKSLSKKWLKIKREETFKESLNYKGIPLLDLLDEKFSEVFKRKLVESIKYIELMSRAVETENPAAVVVIDEYGLYGRAAIFAARLNGIPTLAIQHGIIGPRHIGYYHKKEEMSRNTAKENHCIIPDKTAVNGAYYKNILIRMGSYPPSSVAVTGQPKYDVLAFADKIYKKERVCSLLKLDPNKKLIVFASQPDSPQANELLFRSIFQAVKKIPGAQLVIKLHPNEYDSSLHERVAREAGVNAVIVKDIDLFELLHACDLMLTLSSTVAIEAMILDKPVITVNLTNAPDAMPFAESGAAIGVYKREDIYPAINKALKNKQVRRNLQLRRKKFVYNNAFKIDGQASGRVINLIKEMLH
jgi:glycosyltransferase involved in cell wall biosynthesis